MSNMRLPVFNKPWLIRNQRYLLLISAIGLFSFLISIVAPLILSLFIIREAKLIPSESESNYVTMSKAPQEHSPGVGGARERKKVVHNLDLDEQIEEQQSKLASLKSEAKKKRTLELMGESNLLLLLNREVTNQLGFFNKWLNTPSDESADDSAETESIENFAQNGKMALNVSLSAPSVINLAQTAKIEVSIDWTFPDGQAVPKKLPVIEPKLESPDFKIAGKPEVVVLPLSNSGTKQQTWAWLISAEKIGDRKIFLSFKSADNHAVAVSLDKETTEYNVVIPIMVLNELGLSSTQYAWAKAIGAMIGIIGTITGYSFWKYRKAKKNKPKALFDNEDNIDAVAVTQAVEFILRAIARHLNEHEAGTQFKEKEKPKVVKENTD